MRAPSRTLPRAAAAILALGLMIAAVPPAAADTRSELSIAQKRLAWLEDKVKTDQSKVDGLHASLRTIAGEVGRSRAAFEHIQAQVIYSQLAIDKTLTRLDEYRKQISAAATQAYIRGPAGMLEALLNSDNFNDAGDAITYSSVIVSHDTALAQEAHNVSLQLDSRKRRQSTLLADQASALTKLSAQQDALTQTFVDEQLRLGELADARAEVESIVNRLRKQLRAEELAAALGALHGTPLPFGKWAGAFLDFYGAPADRNNLVVMVAWATAEYTQARWNPLATTMPMPGATSFNSSGVRNYTSLNQGLQATLKTLQRPGHGYEQILIDLKTAADSMTTAKAINASEWCHGCADGQYVIELIPAVQRYYDRYAGARA